MRLRVLLLLLLLRRVPCTRSRVFLTWALAASAELFLHGEKHSQGSTLVKPTLASDPRDLG